MCSGTNTFRSKPRLWLGALLLLLAACGTDKDAAKGAEVLRFDSTAPAGAIGDAYTFNLVARGGQQPYRYKLDGSLPKGLTFSGNRISGVPTEKGSFKLRVTVEDANLSTKFSEPVITIGDPTPPEFLAQLPQAETDQTFIFAGRIRGRETGAIRATFQIKDLKPDLESFEVPLGFISISRYDAQKGTLDFDGVFLQPSKDLEVFRLDLRPEQALKPQTTIKQSVAFYDKALKTFPQTPEVKREPSEGKYSFADLQAIAKNWKKAVKLEPTAKAEPGKEAEQGKAEAGEEGKTEESDKAAEEKKDQAAEPVNPEAKAGEKTEDTKTDLAKTEEPKTESAKAEEPKTDPAKTEEPKTDPAKTEASKEPAKTEDPKEPAKPGEAEKTEPAKAAEAEKSAEAKTEEAAKQEEAKTPEAAKQPETKEADPKQPTQPGQAQPTQPGQAQPNQPGQAQPAQPSQPKADPNKLEGDLNNDLVVNEKDLEVLRTSYRWESVAGAATPNPTDPANPGNPAKPTGPGTPPRTPEPGK